MSASGGRALFGWPVLCHDAIKVNFMLFRLERRVIQVLYTYWRGVLEVVKSAFSLSSVWDVHSCTYRGFVLCAVIVYLFHCMAPPSTSS